MIGAVLESQWVIWARKLQAIAQTGLTFSNNEFDKERYEAVSEIAAEIMDAHIDDEIQTVREFFAQDSGYATPKVDVRGAVFQDNKLLLVRERRDGLWTLPGGWADVNDSPSEAIEREILEESGFVARANRLVMVLDKSKHDHPPSPRHTYKIFFQCELLSGEATLSHETDGVEFFGAEELPPLSIHRTTGAQIARLFEHFQNPDLAPDFD